MNKKTSIFLGFFAVAFGYFMLAPKTALAYRGDATIKGSNYTQERHEAMEKAFESGDYNAWKSLMSGRGRVLQVINEQNFAKFAQIHELAEQGKADEANKIRAELGLGLHNGTGRGYGRTNR